jgi:hypothetical protein
MKTILALATFLLMAGLATAALPVSNPIALPNLVNAAPVSYEQLAGFNLVFGTPAFTAGWGVANASATAPSEALKSLMAITSISIIDPTKAINTHRDPSSSLNMSVASLSGINTEGVVLKDLSSEKWDNLAVAQGSAATDVTGIHSAWTVAQFKTDATSVMNTDAIDNVDSATSKVSGGAAAIADHVTFGF